MQTRDCPSETFHLLDGRALAFRQFGDATGFPVLAFHGTPGSSLKFASFDAAATKTGLKIYAIDRWGYGASDAVLGEMRSFAGFTDDIAQFIEAHGLKSFATLGISGGGPFAAVISSQLQEKVKALILIAPVGLFKSRQGQPVPLGWFHHMCFRVLPRVPFAIRGVFAVFRKLVLARPELAIRLATSRACQSDQVILQQPGKHRSLAAVFSDGLRSGVAGAHIDMTLFAEDWGRDVTEITVPTSVWFGAQDGNVPTRAIDVLVANIPGVERCVVPDAGHYWIMDNEEMVLDWIASKVL